MNVVANKVKETNRRMIIQVQYVVVFAYHLINSQPIVVAYSLKG